MIKTKIVTSKQLTNKSNLKLIGRALANSKLVIFPTETVYGIGANALDSNAANKIYKTKGRPSDNPLIVHIANKNDVRKYTISISKDAKKLILAFWPGPLTLIFKKNGLIPSTTTGGLKTIAIRMPSNKIALKIIKYAKVPVAAPSANLSGEPSSTKFKHVLNDFYNKVDYIIDGGDSKIGLESTVLDTTGKNIAILRPGFISKKMIEEVLNKKIIDKSNSKPKITKSPGMKYVHYKPKGELTIIDGKIQDMAKYVNRIAAKSIEKIVVICEQENIKHFKVKTIALGSAKKPSVMAHNLFATLRLMDEIKAKKIYIHHLGSKDLAYPIMNRLFKAAGYKVVKV
jgi:L-threonylcarbamoyladenylate synthase